MSDFSQISAWQTGLLTRTDLSGEVADIETRLRRLEAQTLDTRLTTVETATTNLTWGAWVNVTGGIGFQNSWADFGGGQQIARYRKNAYEVQVEGLIAGGTLAATAFTLPSGYRPAAAQFRATAANRVVNTDAQIARIDIATSGTVTPQIFTNSGAVTHFTVACTFGLG